MNLYVEKNSILYSIVFCFFLLHSTTLLSHSHKKHKIKKVQRYCSHVTKQGRLKTRGVLGKVTRYGVNLPSSVHADDNCI